IRKITIAIDGYSSCGKSTVAKGLAGKLGYAYIDSGAMYRAVTFYCLQEDIIKNGKFNEEKVVDALKDIQLEFRLNDKIGLSEIYLNGMNVEENIRDMHVSKDRKSVV